MKKNKIIVLIALLISILVLITFFVHYSYEKKYQKREMLQEMSRDNYILRVYKEDSKNSYGSGHKVLYLYNEGNLVEKKEYGNHPLIIKSIDNGVVRVVIPITFYEKNDVEYIKGWCAKNQEIGLYKIDYDFFYDPATSTDQFVYPHN